MFKLCLTKNTVAFTVLNLVTSSEFFETKKRFLCKRPKSVSYQLLNTVFMGFLKYRLIYCEIDLSRFSAIIHIKKSTRPGCGGTCL